ncbi:MAG TPA: PAS domain S-box protein [Opitutaceae bacterium]|nr:PAS domain S-box protein [Opitutaceae bacterium]
MHHPEDNTGMGNRWTQWRESIIGLGEQSSRKSYYPELQRRLAELKDSEEKLRAVFNSTHDAIFIHRYDGTIDEVNDPMLALFGVPRERALQFTVADYTSAEAGRERLPLLLEELRHTGKDQLFELRARRPLDGTEFEVEVSLHPSFWGGHEVVVAVVRDITERKQAEAERRRLEAELAQLYRMESIGRLAGGVAHDFNNMLTPILSYAVMLRDDLPGDDERRVDLGEIVRSAERARDLVRQLLAFARRQTFELRPLDLNGTIRGFERMLRRVLREDIALRLELAPQPATIAADVGQIEQVLMNLVVNAQDAMPQGGTLVLATAALPPGGADPGLPDGPLVRMCVKDTGTGMDAATVARIFEPFFTTKEQGKGTGLGLASVYGIVQQHGGQILVHSQPGQGSTFSLYFPRLDASQCAGAAPEPPVVAGQTGAGTILVAEDQEQVRFLVAKVLGRAGYRVLVAASGDEALRLAEAQHTPIDLLVSDVVMPGLNGRELYGRLQERWPGIRALFVSGYAAEVVATGLDLLPKPFTPDVLLSRVRHALLS